MRLLDTYLPETIPRGLILHSDVEPNPEDSSIRSMSCWTSGENGMAEKKCGHACLAAGWQRHEAKASLGHFRLGGLTGNFHDRPHTLSACSETTEPQRWISYPGAERDGDTSPVIAWAGWDHLDQAKSLAEYFLDAKDAHGWQPAKLNSPPWLACSPGSSNGTTPSTPTTAWASAITSKAS